MKATLFLYVVLTFTIFANYQILAQDENTLVDERDGQSYKTIKVGESIWMARNLNFETEGSTWYENKKKYANKHGRLYTWEEAKTVCPSGWRLPSDEDWTALINAYGGSENAGLELKADGTSGFDVFFSGFRDSVGTYYDLGNDANFWTSTSVGKKEAWRCYLDRGYNEVVQDYYNKTGGLSVRCIKE